MPIKNSQASAQIGEFARYGFLKRSTASTGIALVALVLFAGSQFGGGGALAARFLLAQVEVRGARGR